MVFRAVLVVKATYWKNNIINLLFNLFKVDQLHRFMLDITPIVTYFNSKIYFLKKKYARGF